jgi:hypothetical protein
MRRLKERRVYRLTYVSMPLVWDAKRNDQLIEYDEPTAVTIIGDCGCGWLRGSNDAGRGVQMTALPLAEQQVRNH